MKLTDVMMWLVILMDFDADSLLRGECDYYLYREQNQGQKIQRRACQAQGKDFTVSREFVLFPSSSWSAGHSVYTGSGNGQGPSSRNSCQVRMNSKCLSVG